jgi:hypothetical protein
MAVLIALTALLTVVALFNLLLTFGLVKRYKELDRAVANVGSGAGEPMLPEGAEFDEFEAVTSDGEPVRHDDLMPGTLIGFFDPSCETCHGHIPDWSAEALQLAQGRMQALAIVREGTDQEEMVVPLSKVARVVVERKRGPIQRAFSVQATPAFCRTGKGQIIERHGYKSQ